MEFDPHIFWKALFSAEYLRGAAIALALAVLSMLAASLIGFGVALCRRSGNALLEGFGAAYVWFFRAIPTLLIFLVVWNVGPQLFPALKEKWFNPFLACWIGLSIVEAAYMAEIIRSALASVDSGQEIAARSLGISPRRVLYRIVLPQAVKVAIPPTSNEFIAVLKYTSLASVISLQELMTVAGINVSNTFKYAEYYSAAAVYYLVIVSVLMLVQRLMEYRMRWVSLPATRGLFPSRRPV